MDRQGKGTQSLMKIITSQSQPMVTHTSQETALGDTIYFQLNKLHIILQKVNWKKVNYVFVCRKKNSSGFQCMHVFLSCFVGSM